MRVIFVALGATVIAGVISYGTVVRFAGFPVSLKDAGAIVAGTVVNVAGDSEKRGEMKLLMEIPRARSVDNKNDISLNDEAPIVTRASAPAKPSKSKVILPVAGSPIPSLLPANSLHATSGVPESANDMSSVVVPNIVEDCDFIKGKNPTHIVLLNEIAWMGSPLRGEEDGGGGAQGEWIELKNNSGKYIVLADWRIVDKAGKFKVIFDATNRLEEGNLFLLERGNDEVVPNVIADKIYTGVLSNSGAWLRLFDNHCVLIDEVDASHGWPAGDNATKKTMERSAIDLSWNTSGVVSGTPYEKNSSMFARNTPPLLSAPPVQIPVSESSGVSPSVTSEESSPTGEEKININTAGYDELQNITGIGPSLAQKVIDYRTQNGLFQVVEDIKSVSGIGDVTFEKMKDEITVGEGAVSVESLTPSSEPEVSEVSGKVNINTANLDALDTITGVGTTIAQRIIDYRNENGDFQTIEEIKNVKGIGDATFEKMKNEITI
ncbi:MAG: helix-hairpin-helix domain-containing protein [Patescibacteria group bacterium]|nr:helix-hairpin-helix domain-containing protein [Patescibacteria group bacterium]